MTGSKSKNKKRIVVLISVFGVALVALLALLLHLLLSAPKDTDTQLPSWVPPPDKLEDREAVGDSDVVAPTAPEDETATSPGSFTPWLTNPERAVPATGEFDVNSVPDNVDSVLSEDVDRYASVIEAITTADPAFSPEGYLVCAHASNDSGGGDVTVTLYIEDIKTSSHYRVNIDSGNIRYIDIIGVYHPTAAEIEQAKKLKADFEASSARKEAIDNARAALWPASDTGTETEYSEYYFYAFKTGKLWLYIESVHSYEVGDGMSVSDVREERIDVQEVLGR